MTAAASPQSTRHSQATGQPGTRPAADRQAAEVQLDELVRRHAPGQASLFAAVRQALRQRLPGAAEIVYEYRDFVVISYSASERGYEGVLALHAGATNGVRLYFTLGKEIPEAARQLAGSGLTRWLAVADVEQLSRPVVAELVELAISRCPTPFPETGPGALVIRPTTAARRRADRGK